MIPKNESEREFLSRLQKLEKAAFDHTFEENYGQSVNSEESETEE